MSVNDLSAVHISNPARILNRLVSYKLSIRRVLVKELSSTLPVRAENLKGETAAGELSELGFVSGSPYPTYKKNSGFRAEPTGFQSGPHFSACRARAGKQSLQDEPVVYIRMP